MSYDVDIRYEYKDGKTVAGFVKRNSSDNNIKLGILRVEQIQLQ